MANFRYTEGFDETNTVSSDGLRTAYFDFTQQSTESTPMHSEVQTTTHTHTYNTPATAASNTRTKSPPSDIKQSSPQTSTCSSRQPRQSLRLKCFFQRTVGFVFHTTFTEYLSFIQQRIKRGRSCSQSEFNFDHFSGTYLLNNTSFVCTDV